MWHTHLSGCLEALCVLFWSAPTCVAFQTRAPRSFQLIFVLLQTSNDEFSATHPCPKGHHSLFVACLSQPHQYFCVCAPSLFHPKADPKERPYRVSQLLPCRQSTSQAHGTTLHFGNASASSAGAPFKSEARSQRPACPEYELDDQHRTCS